jgi:hypothetical protein
MIPYIHSQISAQIIYKEYRNPIIETTRMYQLGNNYQKDFLLFIDILKTTHPAFSPTLRMPLNLDSIINEGYQWAATCNSLSKFKIYLQKIASLLQDGHTFVIPDLDRNLLYPFQIFIDDQRVYLYLIDKVYQNYLGKQITHINNHPVFEVILSFIKKISCDNINFCLYQVVEYMMFFSQWKDSPFLRTDSSLILSFLDGDSIILKPGTFDHNNISKINTQQKINSMTNYDQNQLFFYTILKNENICYFQFNQCVDQSTLRYQKYISKVEITQEMEEELIKYPRFDTLIANMFSEIKKQNIQTLIIDVRNNRGGNSKLCDILLSYLKPIKEMKSWHNYIRISSFMQEMYPIIYKEYERKIIKNGQTIEMGMLYPINFNDNRKNISALEKRMSKYFIFNKNKSKIFTGNVIFIQGKSTFSSAGNLIVNAVDNKIGQVIGIKSVYKPCNYGDILGWQLPHTRIKGGVSFKIFNRPDENKCQDSYLFPDILIERHWQDFLQEDDLCWKWIIEHYK